MKLNVLEAHDRLKYLMKDQSEAISRGASECLLVNPDSLKLQDKSPYVYIFAHARKTDDVRNERLLWQPRLSIPEPATNSYLFRTISKTDKLEIVWMIPKREMWDQFRGGNVTESNLYAWSIDQFLNNRIELGKPHPDDMPEEKAKMIFKSVLDEHMQEIKRKQNMVKIDE